MTVGGARTPAVARGVGHWYLMPVSLGFLVEAGCARDDPGRALSEARSRVVIVIMRHCSRVSNRVVAVR